MGWELGGISLINYLFDFNISDVIWEKRVRLSKAST